jgi:hypothetical protein
MNRPEVRIIDQQSEEIKPADISQTEKEALLAKYGYGPYAQQSVPQYRDPKQDMTFEELCRMEEQKLWKFQNNTTLRVKNLLYLHNI